MRLLKHLLIISILVLGISFSYGQVLDSLFVEENYEKSTHYIELWDGVKLFTIVYEPKDKSVSYPILMNRTCYNVASAENYQLSYPSKYLVEDKYILVYQDVRGRYRSEGEFDNMRPNIPGNKPKKKKDIDESSDTWDTIDWLVKNIDNNNGKVGMMGISYPGFYTSAALPDAHPALRAVSPQAPIADFYFDDFHHHGAFIQGYVPIFPVFGVPKDSLTDQPWFLGSLTQFLNPPIPDGYAFHLGLGPLKNVTEKYYRDNFFWQQVIQHPNYDEFWQKRSILPHLRNINAAVMTVGGWFDAEDLYGPLNTYKTIEKYNPNSENMIVMGPWTHGDWARPLGKQTVNHIYFGDSISNFYQKEIERKYFAHYLKGNSEFGLPEAYMFDTGLKKWKQFEEWPKKDETTYTLYFADNGLISIDEATDKEAAFDYISDPNHPVPYRSEVIDLPLIPKMFITDDQRHASRRPDVLSFQTPVLTEDLTISGEILANLIVSTTGTDADFIVKLIDVYPYDHPNYEHNPSNIKMGGYQQLVRHEVFRGRFRDSYSNPSPFKPNVPTTVKFPLQDVLHTFKKGHRMMIQIHSTWFPYIDRNPQKYVDNIFEANEEDFIKSTITLHASSFIKIGGKLSE